MNIISVTHIKEYILKITFDNGIVRNVDFEKGLRHAKNPMNTKYRDIALFKKVKIVGGDLFWGREGEMALEADVIYHQGSELLLV